MSTLSSNIFSRLELLRKWQDEQQERLQKQKSEQAKFLSSEQKRLNEAFDNEIVNSTPIKNIRKLEPILEVSNVSIDEKEIVVPQKDFDELIEEKLTNDISQNDTSVVKQTGTMSKVKPKKPFLKKGTGLARFGITKSQTCLSNTSQKSAQTTKNRTQNEEKYFCVKSGVQEIIQRASWAKVLQNSQTESPAQEKSVEQSLFERQLEKELGLKDTPKNQNNSQELENIKKELQNEKNNNKNAKKILLKEEEHEKYAEKLKNEIKKATTKDICLEKILEHDREINNILGKDPNSTKQELDELEIFELLEEKALNSSFCSSSSVINRLLGFKSPQKPKNVQTPDPSESEKKFRDESEWTSDEESSAESSNSETSETLSSISVLCVDVATNTEVLYPNMANTELLKSRLEELENEIETFRNENSKMCKIKNDLSREKTKLEREIQEQRQQLEEERKKLNKEKSLLNEKYMREMKIGTKKEREEISFLKNELATLKEEIKVKETRYGASQARQRNQIRTLEKEVSTLKEENEKLRIQNGKLQTQIQQYNKKQQPPTDTKVLHEINKNLSLLTKQQRQRSLSETSSLGSEKENESETLNLRKKSNKQNIKPKRQETNKSLSKSYNEPSFELVAKDYERVFGMRNAPPRMDGRASSDGNETYSERQNRSVASAERVERLLPDGTKEITYANGNVKSVSGDKITMKYFNGDIKITDPQTGTIRYFYSDGNIWHTTYAEDGLEILQFPDGQVEKRRRDGSSEINFPDGIVRCLSPTGTEKLTFPDSTVVINKQNGDKILTMPNGQKEIHTSEHKRREYPDGTVKILYPDGTQETRYANGRIRLKDSNGELIMDTADMNLTA